MADDVLVRDYDDMTMEERARAIEEARRLGWESASAYFWSHDDDDDELDSLKPRDYIPFIVEPAYAVGQCSEATYKAWEQASDEELEADPRVQAFLQAWAEEIKTIKEEW